MLTARENFFECIKGGNPDRYVNNYEFISLQMNPSSLHSPRPAKGGADCKNAWGVTYSYPPHVPAAYPVHTPDKVVIQDIENWKDYVKAPSLDFPEAEWEMFQEKYAAVDANKALVSSFVAPGLFEQCHHLGEIANTLMNLAEYEDEMHELIKYLTEYELKLAELICSKLKPDTLFHHDDWGGQNTTFMSVSMFEDFFVDPYKEIYGYYHDHGVECVIHHSDSYAATFVPAMIEMGIDVWQGCFSTNNLPELVKKYGGQISFMGGIENLLVDYEGWTNEDVKKVVEKTLGELGPKYFIPCIAQGGPGSVYPGAYAALVNEIDQYNVKHFGHKLEDIKAARIPQVVMFPAPGLLD